MEEEIKTNQNIDIKPDPIVLETKINVVRGLKDINNSLEPISQTIQSPNFKSGSKGWRGNSNGDLEPNNLVLSDTTNADVSTSKHGFAPKGDGSTTKFLNANGVYSSNTPGLKRVGGSNIETTTTASANDLVTISGLSIPAGTRVRITGRARKTSGAVQWAALGLKINATTVMEANGASPNDCLWAASSNNYAQDGIFWIEFEVGEANYSYSIQGGYSTFKSSTGAFETGSNVWTPTAFTAAIPSATITSIIIRGASNSASVTLAVYNVQIYTYGLSA